MKYNIATDYIINEVLKQVPDNPHWKAVCDQMEHNVQQSGDQVLIAAFERYRKIVEETYRCRSAT